MYVIPIGLWARGEAAAGAAGWLWAITHNLLPVTLGNILGGTGLVRLVYWFVYVHGQRSAP